ncbi:MAG: ChbG/HpnK family deacetylase [Firmicutes bacterium]|nr:ChbG/HpnK family deacetylase [Bacillota bacterium]
MRRLIINADGLGFSPGVNRGIRETAAFGLVKSTSALVNFEAAEEIPQFARDFPMVSIGIHLNLTVGRPVAEPSRVRSLIDPQSGEFYGNRLPFLLMSGRVKWNEICLELESQVKKMIDFGIQITHVDGHQNKHLYPPLFFAVLETAKKYGIKRIRSHRRFLTGSPRQKLNYYVAHPQRLATHMAGRVLTDYARVKGLRCADRLISPGYADSSRKYLLSSWMELAKILPSGTSEIYCHPAYPDDILRRYATYVEERRIEVEVLTSEELRASFAMANIEIISFYDL